MRNHGVFAVGKDARAAAKAAVMCEDVARTAHIARSGGELVPIEMDDIDRLYDRHQNGSEELSDLAEMARTELLLIDADTTTRGLTKEIRWNAAYHRLAAGF